MKIEAGRFQYPFPGDRLERAYFWNEDPKTHPGEPAYPLLHLDPADMVQVHGEMEKSEKGKFTARPMYISVIEGALWLFPIPDKDLVARVRYSTIAEM